MGNVCGPITTKNMLTALYDTYVQEWREMMRLLAGHWTTGSSSVLAQLLRRLSNLNINWFKNIKAINRDHRL